MMYTWSIYVSPKPPKGGSKFHFAILRIEVTRASRGLSAIAELLVDLATPWTSDSTCAPAWGVHKFNIIGRFVKNPKTRCACTKREVLRWRFALANIRTVIGYRPIFSKVCIPAACVGRLTAVNRTVCTDNRMIQLMFLSLWQTQYWQQRLYRIFTNIYTRYRWNSV